HRVRTRNARRGRGRISRVATKKRRPGSRGVTAASPRGAHESPRPLASPVPILIVISLGAIAVSVAIFSILRHPTAPAVIAEDYTRVAGGLLVPEVRGTDRAAVARALNARHPSLVVRLPQLRDAGYSLGGGAIRPL